MASNIVEFSNYVFEEEAFESLGIVCMDEVAERRLQKLDTMAKAINRNNRVIVRYTGEIKIVRSSHNAKASNLVWKHKAILVSTHDSKWVALDCGCGRPVAMAAESCSRIYPHDLC